MIACLKTIYRSVDRFYHLIKDSLWFYSMDLASHTIPG